MSDKTRRNRDALRTAFALRMADLWRTFTQGQPNNVGLVLIAVPPLEAGDRETEIVVLGHGITPAAVPHLIDKLHSELKQKGLGGDTGILPIRRPS